MKLRPTPPGKNRHKFSWIKTFVSTAKLFWPIGERINGVPLCNYKTIQNNNITAVIPLTRALKGFFLRFKPAFWWTSINRYQDSFSVSWALGRICRRFSRFCNILLQDLTPLHVKITRRKNLLSVSRRKLKLSTYLHTVSYNHISFLNRSQLVWVLASSGFYSITWRMISSKIHFRKQPPFRGNFSPFRCDIFCFFEFILA